MLLFVTGLLMQEQPFDSTAFQRELYGLDAPPMVLVSEATLRPELMNVPVIVCGFIVRAQSSGSPPVISANGTFLLLEPSADGKEPESACIRGVIYRRTGMSEGEAKAAGAGVTVVSNGPSPTFMLYRCASLEDCKRLAQTGPRGRHPS